MITRTVLLAFVLLLTMAPAATAQTSTAQMPTAFRADLKELNGSGVTGTADLTLRGTELELSITAKGTAADLPHAQHLHGVIGEVSVCPPPEADQDGDGLVSVIEGVPFYGGVLASLTTSGDTSADSGLAVDRFPTAGADGTLTYKRTLDLPADVAADLGNLHVVVHGIDLDDSGAYDGEARSDLDDSLPLEATIPAACGTLAAMPSGGVATGAGGTAADAGGTAATPLTAVVVVLVGGLLTDALVRRRRALRGVRTDQPTTGR
ncbi:MAG TPA: hypothetical protein VK891_03455 [Euzebyales bacterium]|nr:hypothetical protein [Euzebyales bacterium]